MPIYYTNFISLYTYIYTLHLEPADRIQNYSYDSLDPSALIGAKPKGVRNIGVLLRVLDSFSSSFKTTAGDFIAFPHLTAVEQMKVFQYTGSVPTLKNEMIRIYNNFSMYCYSRIMESTLLITIKDYIKQECRKQTRSDSLDGITVTQLFMVRIQYFFII